MTTFHLTRFRDLTPGETFHFARNPESGLLTDLDKPGHRIYTKLSARRWEETEYGIVGHVGSINVRVWRIVA
jgi:hypothetical protein